MRTRGYGFNHILLATEVRGAFKCKYLSILTEYNLDGEYYKIFSAISMPAFLAIVTARLRLYCC
jgi:hypothetical protein